MAEWLIWTKYSLWLIFLNYHRWTEKAQAAFCILCFQEFTLKKRINLSIFIQNPHHHCENTFTHPKTWTALAQAAIESPSTLSRRTFIFNRSLRGKTRAWEIWFTSFDYKGKKEKQSTIKKHAILPVPLRVVFLFVYSLIICPIVFTFSLNIIPRACTIKRYVLATKRREEIS